VRRAEPIQQGAFPRLIPEGPAERERRLILRPGVGIGKPLRQTMRPGPVEISQRQAERVLGLWGRQHPQRRLQYLLALGKLASGRMGGSQGERLLQPCALTFENLALGFPS
jgi:hypothetical protein